MVEPIYVLEPRGIRIVVPEFFKLLGLIMTFYLAIRLNLFLLNIEISTVWHTLIFVVLMVLLVVEILLKLKKTPTYKFYNDSVSDGINSIYLNQANLVIERNLLDKILGTETLSLTPNFKLESISADNQIYAYIQSLIKYSKGGEQYGS